MYFKIFKTTFYTILVFIILFYYTKDVNIFGKNFYKNIKEIVNSSDTDLLVNKNNKLSKKYIPNDLILLGNKYSNNYRYLRKEAAEKFEKLSDDAYSLGFEIIAVSAYRSYIYQNELYNYYVRIKGKIIADNCSARPGHSEHQTGLAVDVMGSNSDYNDFENSIEFHWMKNNAYKYGFVLRYPKGKENITGFKYEPWHYRYVGNELALYLYENNLTLEEYKKMKI